MIHIARDDRDVIDTAEGLAAMRVMMRELKDELPPHVGLLMSQVFRADGSSEKPVFSHNGRVNGGAIAQAGSLFGPTQFAPFQYIGCTASKPTFSINDTSLQNEYVAPTDLGFARALVALAPISANLPTSLNGTYSAVLTKLFTGTATWTVQAIALFNNATFGSGQMFSEIWLSALATGANQDSLSLTYTITQ